MFFLILSYIFSARRGTAITIDGLSALMSSPIVRSDSLKNIGLPFIIGTTKLVQNAYAWKSGRMTRNVSSFVIGMPNAPNAPSASDVKFPCVSIAPLGLPVVPDV